MTYYASSKNQTKPKKLQSEALAHSQADWAMASCSDTYCRFEALSVHWCESAPNTPEIINQDLAGQTTCDGLVKY